jgi:hypothetical protein
MIVNSAELIYRDRYGSSVLYNHDADMFYVDFHPDGGGGFPTPLPHRNTYVRRDDAMNFITEHAEYLRSMAVSPTHNIYVRSDIKTGTDAYLERLGC